MHNIFESKLSSKLLTMLSESKYRAAVAIIKCGNKYLLGLSNADDDRHHKWCHPGGHIESGETPAEAAVREAKEEMGIRCKPISNIYAVPNKKDVCCCLCKCNDTIPPKPNEEFSTAAWFTIREMRSLKLYDNTRELIEIVGDFK